MEWKGIIDWTNINSGFLSLILFVVTILFGWISGLFNSIIKRPKLRVRFIEKASFYSSFNTGSQYYHPELKETFDIHQTGFAIYMSIANIGNKPTSIDKILIGYYRNSRKRKWFDRQINWLTQCHIFEDFKFEFKDKILLIPPLRIRTEYFNEKHDDSLDIGKSIIGAAYFEQEEAWGNFNPRTIDEQGTIKVIIKIQDIYERNYYFKTKLKTKTIEEARTINLAFGKSLEYTN